MDELHRKWCLAKVYWLCFETWIWKDFHLWINKLNHQLHPYHLGAIEVIWFEFVTFKAGSWKVWISSNLYVLTHSTWGGIELMLGYPSSPEATAFFFGGRRSWRAGPLNPCCLWLIFPGRWGWMGLILDFFFLDGFAFAMRFPVEFCWGL